MYKQQNLFNGIATLPENRTNIVPHGSYSGREIDWTQNMHQLNDNQEAHQAASGRHNQNNQAYYDRTMQQKAGLGIRDINVPSNFQGVKSIPYRNTTTCPKISDNINTSSRKISSSAVIPAIEPYPRQFLP